MSNAKTRRAWRTQIQEAYDKGLISMPIGETRSSIANWSMQKCVQVMADNNLVPNDFGFPDEQSFKAGKHGVTEAAVNEAAAIQLARALVVVDELSRKLDTTNAKLDTLIHIVGRKP